MTVTKLDTNIHTQISTKLHPGFGVQLQPENLNSGAAAEILYRHKLVLIRGLKFSDEASFLKFSLNQVEGANRAVEWDFGSVMRLEVRPAAKNYLFSREPVPMHWDGAFHKEPRFLVFFCNKLAAENPKNNQSGATLFSDVERLWRDTPAKQKTRAMAVKLQFLTEKKAHYGGQIERSLVEDHPYKNDPILRVAEQVRTERNPVERTVWPQTDQNRELVHGFEKSLYDEDYLYRHKWRQGDLLIADNHSLLHGRDKLDDDVSRELWRVQLI